MAEFRLYDGGTASFLGSYRSAEDAYAAADEHTLVVLAAAGGWVVVEHLCRALVKHSGLAPAEQTSGKLVGRTRLTGRGRPGLRTAAWRAAWGAMKANTIYQARFTHLTTRELHKLKPAQARCAIAAALLRQLHAVVTTGQAWNPVIAANGTVMTRAA